MKWNKTKVKITAAAILLGTTLGGSAVIATQNVMHNAKVNAYENYITSEFNGIEKRKDFKMTPQAYQDQLTEKEPENLTKEQAIRFEVMIEGTASAYQSAWFEAKGE